MKTTLMILTAAVLLLTACQKPSGTFGEAPKEGEPIPISHILKTPEDYAGKTVKISGEITSECPSGGWFYLKDQGGEVFVNLHPTHIAIPQAVGQTAVAEGTVKKEGVTIEIVGTGVNLP